MEIRKLVEFDYDQVIELYTQLDEFHVQAVPIALCIGRKIKYIPRMLSFIIWPTPVGWNWEYLMAIYLSVSFVQRCGKKALCAKI